VLRQVQGAEMMSQRTRIALSWVSGWTAMIILGAPALAAVPADPSNLTALPRYTTPPAMVLSWEDESNNETGFKIERKPSGGAYQQIDTVGADVEEYVDTTPSYGTTYSYRVRAYNNDGDSGYSDPAENCVDVVWPFPTTHEMLHGYQDGLDTAGDNGFHQGVDFQAGAGGQDFNAARGGTVADAGGAGTQVHVNIMVDMGGGNVEYDWFYHLKVGSLTVMNGTIVKPGQKIGEVVDAGPPNGWNPPWEHIHWDVRDHAAIGQGAHTIRNPLTVFDTNADKDPNQANPAVEDRFDDGPERVLYNEHGSAQGTYFAYNEQNNPLHGNIDIIAEVHDQMGTEPKQSPLKLEKLGTVTYFVSFPPSERGSVCERILPPPRTTSTRRHAGGWSSRSHSASLTPCSDLPRPVRIVPLVLPLCQGRHVHR